MSEPRVGRPSAEGYGFPDDTAGALPWAWAEERLRDCRNYFVGTVRSDGSPHTMPVWGLWLENTFYFSTSIESVKSRNLLRDPRATVTAERGPDAVVVEGVCDVIDTAAAPGFVGAYKAKYDYEMREDKIWRMRPTRVFGFIEDDSFSTTATKWTFD